MIFQKKKAYLKIHNSQIQKGIVSLDMTFLLADDP